MTVPEYTPGEWYGVVSGDMAVLLHPATPDAVVRAVWSALREREGLSRPLESLLADGITGLRPFAAVRVAGEGLHTALRGDVAIVTTRSGEQQRRSAPQVVLWTEDSDAAADRVELRADGVPERTEDQTLPVTEGVVRASRIVLDGRVRGTASAGADGSGGRPGRRRERAAEPRTPERVTAPEPSAAPRVEREPSAAPRVEREPVADATEVLPAVPDRNAGRPELPAPRASARPAVAPAAAPAPAAPAPAAPVPAAPAPLPAAPVAVAPAPVLPGPASEDDHDGMTILSGELASIRQNLPSWAVSESGQWPSGPTVAPGTGSPAAPRTAPLEAVALTPPAPAPDSFPRVALSTGVVVPVDGVLLIGRAPQAARAPEGVRTRLVAVPSPTQDISRTHAELRVSDGRVLVTDLFSTNGVTVASGGLPPRKIAAGEPVAVGAGEVVDLGDGVTFTVEPPA